MVEKTYGHLTNREFQRAMEEMPSFDLDILVGADLEVHAEEVAEAETGSKRVVNSPTSVAPMACMARESKEKPRDFTGSSVPRGGVEPPARGFSERTEDPKILLLRPVKARTRAVG